MSTTYYLRLKDNKELDEARTLIEQKVEEINKHIDIVVQELYKDVICQTGEIKDKDNFNKQFCNSIGWYGDYTDESEKYHFNHVMANEIEDIQLEIGTYSAGKFNWKLFYTGSGYYDLKGDRDTAWYDLQEIREYELPRNVEQFKAFMKKYKNKVEIVDEYGDTYTTTKFLNKIG